MCSDNELSLFFWLSPLKTCMHFTFPPCSLHALHISSSLILPFKFSEKYNLQCSSYFLPVYYFIPLGPKHSSYTLFSNICSLCFFPRNVRGKVSHLYKTIGKVIVFVYFTCSSYVFREQKSRQNSELIGNKHYLNSICS